MGCFQAAVQACGVAAGGLVLAEQLEQLDMSEVPAPDTGFSVTFASPKFQPVTVPVQVIRNPGDFASPATTIIEPSPVFAELRPAAPPAKVRKPMRPKKPKPPEAAAAPAPAPAQPAAR
jgi:hypothetical protein